MTTEQLQYLLEISRNPSLNSAGPKTAHYAPSLEYLDQKIRE